MATRQILYILGVVVLNALLANLLWRVVGARSRNVRVAGRVSAAFLCLANMGLALVGFLFVLQHGWDWFYMGLMAQALVFAFRVGGATVGRYP